MAARLVNFFKQYKNTLIVNKLPLVRVPYKTTYFKYKETFDKFAFIFNKYDLNAEKYIDFFVKNFYRRDDSIDDFLINNFTIVKYIEELQIKEKHEQIYKWFMKSVDNIAENCVKENYFTTKDYLRHLIFTNKIANYVISGKISIYYLAAIPKFNKTISYLNDISRDELNDLYKRYDIYNTEINEAFLEKTRFKANPLKMTDERISQLKNK